MITLENNLSLGQRALLIEPEDEARRALQLLLQGWRVEVRSYPTAAAGLADPLAVETHIVLLAQILLESGRCPVLNHLRERGWNGVAVLIAAARSPALAQEADASGFRSILVKPVGRLDLLKALAG